MEDLDKDEVGSELTGEDMAKLWSNKDVFGRDKREPLVWHHRLKHCSFKSLLGLSKRVIIPRNLSKIRKLHPCVACLFVNSHKIPWRTKGKHLGGSTRRPSDTTPVAMTSIDQMVSAKPGLTPQVTGFLTHAIF